jgi:hypothetical protein
MATITAASGGGNWSATTTWTGAVVPGASDDVLLNAGVRANFSATVVTSQTFEAASAAQTSMTAVAQ